MVYVRSNARTENEDGESFSMTRSDLFKDCTDVSEPEDVDETLLDTFLQNAVDVRYFGATLSFKASDDLMKAVHKALPSHLVGPVQFSPGRSLNRVELNEEYNSLTSVIATKEGKEQGGFGLDDHRIKYGLFAFHGLVNENGSTQLSEGDVERLDTLCWRALKNQTLTRSKVGQEPQLYARVEYTSDNFHLGGLQNGFSLGEGSLSDEQLRNIGDCVIDAEGFVDRVTAAADHIDTVHLTVAPGVRVRVGGEEGDGALLESALADAGVTVHSVDVANEYTETLPN
jgi:CRISPR-associated protein Csh2